MESINTTSFLPLLTKKYKEKRSNQREKKRSDIREGTLARTENRVDPEPRTLNPNKRLDFLVEYGESRDIRTENEAQKYLEKELRASEQSGPGVPRF